jgi:hypothetical protein
MDTASNLNYFSAKNERAKEINKLIILLTDKKAPVCFGKVSLTIFILS